MKRIRLTQPCANPRTSRELLRCLGVCDFRGACFRVSAQTESRAGAVAGARWSTAASTAGTIFLARRIAGRHRVAGIMLMAALDGAYAFIAARNFVLTDTGR